MPGDEYVLEYAWELARCSSAVEGAAREGGGGEMVRESGGEEEREDDAEELELRLRVRERFWDAETEETVRVRSDAVDLSARTDGGGGGGARMAARSTRRRARRGAKRRARRRAKTSARRAATISRTQRGSPTRWSCACGCGRAVQYLSEWKALFNAALRPRELRLTGNSGDSPRGSCRTRCGGWWGSWLTCTRWCCEAAGN